MSESNAATDLGSVLYPVPDPHPATNPATNPNPTLLSPTAPPSKPAPADDTLIGAMQRAANAIYGKPADWENHPDNPNRIIRNADTHHYAATLAEGGHLTPLQAVAVEQHLNAELRTLPLPDSMLQTALRDSAKPVSKMSEAEVRAKVASVNRALAAEFGATGATAALQDAKAFLAKHPVFAGAIDGTLAALSADLTVHLVKAARKAARK